MLDTQEMMSALSAELPPELHDRIPALAELLVAAQAHPGATPAPAQLQPLIAALAGHTVSAGAAQISFGSDNDFHDITIGDVAGGNLVKLNLTFQESLRTTRRLGLIVAGLVVVVVLAGIVLIQNNADRSRRLAQSQQALAADVFANLSNLDAQLLFVDTSLSQSLDPNAASSLQELIGLQQVAALQSGLNRNPLDPTLNPTLSEAVVASGANADQIQQFYQTLRVTEDTSVSLLDALSGMARSGPQATEQRDQYRHIADLNRRMFALNGQIAYLQGLLVLHDLQTDPNAMSQRLSLLQKLRPATFSSREDVTRELATQIPVLEGLITERSALITQSQDGLDQSLDINDTDTWQAVVGKAIALRKRGQIAASVAAFKRYGELFKTSDPTAAQYAQVGQQVTQRISDLGIEGGVYIWDLQPDNPARQAGFQVGDIVTSFNNLPVETIDGFEAAQSSAPTDVAVPVTVLRLQPDGSFTRQTITVKGRLVDASVMPI